MVTNQIMTRKMAGYDVIQRTEDGFFDANFLIHQWNSKEENKRRRLDDFLESSNTKEFIVALKEDESQWRKIDNGNNQAVIKVRGRNTKHGRTRDATWMHPILFYKFAMWISPRFELQVIKFVSDKMLDYRNKAGDAYRDLSAAVQKISNREDMQKNMRYIAEAINYVIFGEHRQDIRNDFGEEKYMLELFTLEKKLADLIEDGFIKTFNELIEYLRKLWNKKQPKVFQIQY